MSKSSNRNYIQTGRARSVKPELFLHEGLFEKELEVGLPLRLAFIGLFTCCDRQGRFPWRPKMLGARILPYDGIDFSRVLDALASRGSVVKYEHSGVVYGCIPSWELHQAINNKEQASIIPPPTIEAVDDAQKQQSLSMFPDASVTREPRDDHACQSSLGVEQGEGKGREGNIESLPDGRDSSSERGKARSKAEVIPVIDLPLNTGANHPVSREDVAVWQGLYQAVDVMQELRKMVGWCNALPERRKTKRGINKFINGWLSRAQDEAPVKQAAGRTNGKHVPDAAVGMNRGQFAADELDDDTLRWLAAKSDAEVAKTYGASLLKSPTWKRVLEFRKSLQGAN